MLFLLFLYQINGKPNLVTKDASQAIPGANMIIFCVPAFAHEQYFRAIEPYIQPNTVIVDFPQFETDTIIFYY